MATTTIRMGNSVGYITMPSPIEVKLPATGSAQLIIPAHQVRASFESIGTSTSRAYKAYYRVFNGSSIISYAETTKTGYVANSSTNANVVSITTDTRPYASSWFNSSNPTTRTITSALSIKIAMLEGYISSSSDPYDYIWLDTPVTVANVNLTLDAPPTFTSSNVSFDTSYVYTGLTTASVDVSSLSAQFGGTITEVKLTIGNQSVTRTNNGTLSILLEAEGTFTPTVTVTDSRGQVTTKTLETITVNGYTAPSAVFTAERTTSTGVDDDEGEYAVLDTNITFTDVVADLTAPTVTIDGTPATVTWYSSRATDGTLSGTVNWSSLTSPATVYGLIDVPNIQTSYSVSLTPNDTKGSGTPITQTIASAFYTIDFLAGGHGIAFGQPSSRNGFECNMPTTFHDTVTMEGDVSVMDANSTLRVLLDFIHPVGSYYETSDTTFDPNVTWGGTWVLEAEGLVHIGAGSTYSVGDTGGEETHTLTTDEMPSHTHNPANGSAYAFVETDADSTVSRRSAGGSTTSNYVTSTKSFYRHTATHATGGGQAHNIMQPYIVVNRWHRTA